MKKPSPKISDECLLVYDGRCRMCVTAKRGLDRMRSEKTGPPLRMMPYQSEEARQALGDAYRSGRPEAAFLINPRGEIARGLDAFLPLLPGLKGGRLLSALFRIPLVKRIGYVLYRLIARYRYSLFGEVPLESSHVTLSQENVKSPCP